MIISTFAHPHTHTIQTPSNHRRQPSSTHPIVVRDGGEAVRDAQHGGVVHALADRLLDAGVRHGVHIGGGLVWFGLVWVFVCLLECVMVCVAVGVREREGVCVRTHAFLPAHAPSHLIHHHHRRPLQQRPGKAQQLPLPHAPIRPPVRHPLRERGDRSARVARQMHAPQRVP